MPKRKNCSLGGLFPFDIYVILTTFNDKLKSYWFFSRGQGRCYSLYDSYWTPVIVCIACPGVLSTVPPLSWHLKVILSPPLRLVFAPVVFAVDDVEAALGVVNVLLAPLAVVGQDHEHHIWSKNCCCCYYYCCCCCCYCCCCCCCCWVDWLLLATLIDFWSSPQIVGMSETFELQARGQN